MAQSNIESDDFLVLQLNGGDRESFQKLYLRYIDRIYSFVLSICKSPELSKDVCHDVFTKIWDNRSDLNSELSFKSFLFSASRNHVLNIIKRASKENKIHDEIIAHISMDEHHAVEDAFNLKETNQLLNEAIEKLPPKRKEVFQLSREEGLSHSEIAEQLGITKGTVNVQMVKALNAIRKHLSENGYHSPMIVLSALIFS